MGTRSYFSSSKCMAGIVRSLGIRLYVLTGIFLWGWSSAPKKQGSI